MSVATLNNALIASTIAPQFSSLYGTASNIGDGQVVVSAGGGYTCSTVNSGCFTVIDLTTGNAGVEVALPGNPSGVTSKHLFLINGTAGSNAEDITFVLSNGCIATGMWSANVHDAGYVQNYAIPQTATGYRWEGRDGGDNQGILNGDSVEITCVGSRYWLKFLSSYENGVYDAAPGYPVSTL